MGEKKGKALALELMDDLLNDKTEKIADDVGAKEQIKKQGVRSVGDVEVSLESPLDLGVDEVNDDRTVPIDQTHNLALPDSPPAKALQPQNSMPSAAGSSAAVTNSGSATSGSATSISEASAPAGSMSSEQGAPTGSEGQGQQERRGFGRSGESRNKARASVGKVGVFRKGGAGGLNATEVALAQSESLRIAQNRLLEFEAEIERLRLQNEELAAAGETLRTRADELLAANHALERDMQSAMATAQQEKEMLISAKEAIQRDREALRHKNEELELRISTNIRRIRVRERELENRLELVKMEGAALIRAKDEMILDLKRQLDQLNIEINNYRTKNQELNRVTSDRQEMLRRTVKALRLALSMLEGDEEVPSSKPGQRKAK